jgi:gluconate kinase
VWLSGEGKGIELTCSLLAKKYRDILAPMEAKPS